MLANTVYLIVDVIICTTIVLYMQEFVVYDEISSLWLVSLFLLGYIMSGNVLFGSVLRLENTFMRATFLKTFSAMTLSISFGFLGIARSAVLLLSSLLIISISKTLSLASLDTFMLVLVFLLSIVCKPACLNTEPTIQVLKGVILVVIGAYFLLKIPSSKSLFQEWSSIASVFLLGSIGYVHSFFTCDMQNQSYFVPLVLILLGFLVAVSHLIFEKVNLMMRFFFATISIFFFIIINVFHEIIFYQNYKMLLMIPSAALIYIVCTRKIHLFVTQQFTIANNNKKIIPPEVLKDRKKRKLLLFLLLTVLVMILELLYGISVNSLGLISDAFHMVIDSISIVVGLFAANASSWPINAEINSFGYSRYEVLGGFINGILLLFISIHIIIESVERIIDPPEISAAYMFTVSLIGLAVNVIGVIFFHDFHVHSHSHGSDNCCSKRVDRNMQGVFLHIVADLLGSISVIVSSIFVLFFNVWVADPICSAFSAILIFISAIPLLISTGRVLLLSSPDSYENFSELLQQKVYASSFLSKVSLPKIWMHSTGSKELLVCLIYAKLKDNRKYFPVRYSLQKLIEEAIKENLGITNVSIILHLE